jgi:hypothetical protein
MKTQIRDNTYETNSSSSHSFIVSGARPEYEVVLPNSENGELVIPIVHREYGWGYKTYSGFMEKVNYMVYQAVDEKHNFFDTVFDDEEIQSFDDISNIKMLRRVIADQVGIDESKVIFVYKEKFGYIDHQSAVCENGEHEAFSSEQALRDTLFRVDLLLEISNDNGSFPEDYIDSRDVG